MLRHSKSGTGGLAIILVLGQLAILAMLGTSFVYITLVA